MSVRSEREVRFSKLMVKAQEGDSGAYQTLLEELYPILRQFVGKRVSESQGSEEVVQEILLAIHRAKPTYRPEDPFEPWLFAIARYKFIDYVRRVTNQRKWEVGSEDWIEAFGGEDRGFEMAKEQIENALSKLPENQRRIVELLKLEGRTIREVAQTLNISESAVKSSAHRAYATLRKEGRGD